MQRKRNKRALEKQQQFVASARNRREYEQNRCEQPLDERTAYAGFNVYTRVCMRRTNVHLPPNRTMNQADSGWASWRAGIIISKEINLSPREKRNGFRGILRGRAFIATSA